MNSFDNTLAIRDSATYYRFSYGTIKLASQELYNSLLQHREICNIRHNAQPFRLTGHIVFCPVCSTRLGTLRGTDLQCFLTTDHLFLKTIGIVGFGNFGQFFAKRLALEADVAAWDVSDRSAQAAMIGVEWKPLTELLASDLLILAVPLSALEPVLAEVGYLVKPDTLVMDVCSVKLEPLRLMVKYLPQCSVIGTHPLFGPQSAKERFSGHKIVLCAHGPVSPKQESVLTDFFTTQLRLEVVKMSAEDHDREMAMVQALTHFIARGAAGCGIGQSQLATAAFTKLLEMTEFLGSDSWELFRTIELGNPYAADMRTRFCSALDELERKLAEGQ